MVYVQLDYTTMGIVTDIILRNLIFLNRLSEVFLKVLFMFKKFLLDISEFDVVYLV